MGEEEKGEATVRSCSDEWEERAGKRGVDNTKEEKGREGVVGGLRRVSGAGVWMDGVLVRSALCTPRRDGVV